MRTVALLIFCSLVASVAAGFYPSDPVQFLQLPGGKLQVRQTTPRSVQDLIFNQVPSCTLWLEANPETKKLDHFNFQDTRTFKQRYYVDDQYWNGTGPAFCKSSFRHNGYVWIWSPRLIYHCSLCRCWRIYQLRHLYFPYALILRSTTEYLPPWYVCHLSLMQSIIQTDCWSQLNIDTTATPAPLGTIPLLNSSDGWVLSKRGCPTPKDFIRWPLLFIQAGWLCSHSKACTRFLQCHHPRLLSGWILWRLPLGCAQVPPPSFRPPPQSIYNLLLLLGR